MKRKEILKIFDTAGRDGLIRLIEHLASTIDDLTKENKELKEKIESLSRDSTNSNKPPSSDGPKKKRGTNKRGSSGRKPGGQKGHKGKTRKIVPPEEVTRTVEHKPEECEKCGKHFTEKEKNKSVERRQVWEIPDIKPDVIEHVFYKTTCTCGHETRLPVPKWIYTGVGENLQSHIAFFTATAKLSRRVVKTVLEEVFKTSIAVGTIQNRLEDTSQILQPIYEELEGELGKQSVVNIDESGFPHNKTLAWIWGFVTQTFAFFTIQASRGSRVLKGILGEYFDGIIICDRYSAYIKYQKDRIKGLLQFCWAHIIREVKSMKYEFAYGSDKLFSTVFRQRIGAVFRLWYSFKNGKISRKKLIELAVPIIKEMRTFLQQNLEAPSKAISKFSKNLLRKWDSFFTFIYHEGVEPTNNLAERLIRAAVLSRKISYCTRSEEGQLLLARLLTISQTCRIQKRNTLEFFRDVIHANRHDLPCRSLLLTKKEIVIRKVA